MAKLQSKTGGWGDAGGEACRRRMLKSTGLIGAAYL
jgi:hypothetical protein